MKEHTKADSTKQAKTTERTRSTFKKMERVRDVATGVISCAGTYPCVKKLISSCTKQSRQHHETISNTVLTSADVLFK
jgi:hypothetical protein